MKCAVKSEQKIKCSGIDIGPEGVICEETPEILEFLARGWLQRMDIPVEQEPEKPRRRK